MLQTMSTKSQKIPEKSKLLLQFPIRLQGSQLKGIAQSGYWFRHQLYQSRNFPETLSQQEIDRSTLLLENNGNSPVSIFGKFTAFIKWKGKVFHQEFHVTDANASPNLLSRDTCFRMEVLQTCFMVTGKEVQKKYKMEEISPFTKPHWKMEEVMHSIDPESVMKSPLTKQEILDVYIDVFKGLGTFSGEHYKFKLKENRVPARHAPRKVPIHLQDDFHQEINDLVKQGVLEKVEHSTEWVNSFVIVETDFSMDSGNSHAPYPQIKKKLQICLGPRDLNEAFECEPYYSRSVDVLIGKFHGCIVFSIVDMKKGYWMAILHPDSRPLTCMSIDIG